jgi:beta-N-acetylhexosaminidase
MEGRRPFDPDDELDFDFDVRRRRRDEGLEEEGRAAEPARPPASEPGAEEDHPSEEYPSEEYPPGPSDDPFAEPAGRRERPRRPRLRIRGLGRRRRSDTGERRATPGDAGERRAARGDTGERRAARGDTGERGVATYETGERGAYETGERGATAYETGEPGYYDDPFTPSEGPASPTRRSRHRDLPAKVRRRQAFGIGAVAVAVIGGAYLLLGGGGGDDEEPLAVKRLVGQSFVGRLGGDAPSPELLKKVRKGQLGGVIVDTANEAAVQASVSQLQQAAQAGGNPQLLVMIDQEGGPVKRLPGPPDLSAEEMGRGGDAEIARSEGEKTGGYLKGFGVNVDLAPVLDVELPRTADTLANRTFGDDAAVVSEMGVAFTEGLQSQSVSATAKHFPGLGLSTLNTDFAPVTVVGQQEEFDAALAPFQAAVDAGVDLVMVSSAAYPDYAGATPGKGKVKPASFAEPIVQGLLRDQLGFDGVVITDDLESIAIKTLTNRDLAAVAALGAGCDLVLYARSERGATQGFNRAVRAVKEGKLDRAALEQSYQRILGLKQELSDS